MGVGGVKPKSTKAHKIEGTFRPTRHGRRKPVKVKGTLREPPSYLSPFEQECWRHTVQYAPQDVLARIDRGTLAAYAVAEARLLQAVQAQNKYTAKCEAEDPPGDPLVWETKTGAFIQSPYLGIINRATDKVLKLASEMGFTPVSRTRLSAATGEALDLPPASSPDDMEAGNDLDNVVSLRPK